ncbi:unnamed protein product, partial [Laminaria digitata]
AGFDKRGDFFLFPSEGNYWVFFFDFAVFIFFFQDHASPLFSLHTKHSTAGLSRARALYVGAVVVCVRVCLFFCDDDKKLEGHHIMTLVVMVAAGGGVVTLSVCIGASRIDRSLACARYSYLLRLFSGFLRNIKAMA